MGVLSPTPTEPHEFEAFDGATGMACTAMVMREGFGEDCGLSPQHPIHTKENK